MRFTAPSLKFSNGRLTLEAGGFQSFEAYDVLVANLDTSLARRAPAEDAAEVLHAFPDGLTTGEVAQIMAEDKYPPDLDEAEDALITATGDGAGAPLPVRTRRAVGAARRRTRSRRRPESSRAPSGPAAITGSSSTG